MPLPRHAPLLFEILGEAVGRPMHVDEIAVKLYGDGRPASHAEVISSHARLLRPVLAELGLGVSCRHHTLWLCDLEHDVTISGPRRRAPSTIGSDRHSRDAVRNVAVLAARRLNHDTRPRP